MSPPPAMAAPAPAPPAAAVPPPQPAPVAAAPVESEPQDSRPRRNWKRHSTGMMAGGIVMVSFVPIALIAAMVADLQQTACESGGTYSFDSTRYTDCDRYDKTIYGGILAGVSLLGAGIPMIVIGSKREPLRGAVKLAPWTTPNSAGLRLRLEL